jgi:predicted Zn-dependent protease
VIAGSGAASAGLHSGDKLVSINGVPLPTGQNAESEARAVLVPLLTERATMDLTVNRNGGDIALKLPLTHACAFAIELGNTAIVNAFADGRRVLVTRGMMKMADSDDELAYVLATEMAHDVLGHVGKLQTTKTNADIIDNLSRAHPDSSVSIAIKPSSQEFEIAADKRGMYMLARAGYAIDNTGKFLTRLATQYPPSATDSYSAAHPLNASRLSSIEKIAAEIKSKQTAKKPLLP